MADAAYIQKNGITGKWNRDVPKKAIEIIVKYSARPYPKPKVNGELAIRRRFANRAYPVSPRMESNTAD